MTGRGHSFQILTDSLHEAIDHLAPDKTFQPKKSKPPWVDAEIRLPMLERDALQRKYDKTGSRVILDKLLEQASLVEERTERARCAFMHDKISDALEDNKFLEGNAKARATSNS